MGEHSAREDLRGRILGGDSKDVEEALRFDSLVLDDSADPKVGQPHVVGELCPGGGLKEQVFRFEVSVNDSQ